MSTASTRRSKHRTRPLDQELALLAEHLRLSRNGGFTLLSYDAPQQRDQWLAALRDRLGDVLFYSVPLPEDGIGIVQRIEAAATHSELATYPLSVMVVGGAEALGEVAQANLVANLNRMRGHLARVAYPLLFCADSATLRLFSQQAPDLFDRIGLWSDLRGFAPPVEVPAPPLDPETQYRETLARRLRLVEFRGILSINKPVTLPLRDFYVPLEAEQRVERNIRGELLFTSAQLEEQEYSFREDEYDDRPMRDIGRVSPNNDVLIGLRNGSLHRKERTIETRKIAVAEAVRDNRTLVVLGDPGAGKSTLLRAIALAVAEGESERVGLELHQKGWLPILVSCAAYSAALERTPELRLIHFIANTLSEQFDVPNTLKLLRIALLRRRVLLLFDGLDEVQSNHRLKVTDAVNTFIKGWCNTIIDGNHAIVSSRIVGYRATQIRSAEATVTLHDFEQPQIEQFLNNWCVAYEQFAHGDVPEARADGEKQAAQLAAEISSNAGARRLAGNPLLLTIMALIQRQGVKMPQRRIELYDIASRTLIETWNQARGLSETILLNLPDTRMTFALLGDLALWMQEHSLAAATTETLLPVLAEAQRKRGISQPEAAAAAFLHDVQQYSGLLAERGPDTYSFLHLTFQEYFAARALAMISDPNERWRRIAPHLHDPRWRETILLAAGELGVRIGREDEVTDLVQRILDATPAPSKLTWMLFKRQRLWWLLRDNQIDQIEEHYLKRHILLAGQILADDVGVAPQLGQHVTKTLLQLSDNTDFLLSNAARTLLKRLPVVFLEHAALPLRRELLQNQNVYVRRNAATALGRLGIASPAVLDALLTALGDQDTGVRRNAASMLELLSSGRPTILDTPHAAFNYQNASAHRSAADALATMSNDSPTILNDFTDSLHKQTGIKSSRSTNARGQSLNANSISLDNLLINLRDQEQSVRRNAAHALGQIGKDNPIILNALIVALYDQDKSVRSSAALAFGQIGNASPAILDALRDALHEKDMILSTRAAVALGQIGDNNPDALNVLLDTLHNKDLSLRSTAAIALGLSKNASSIILNALCAAIHDKNESVSMSAAIALGQIGNADPVVIESLCSILDSQSEYVSSSAAIALTKLRVSSQKVRLRLLEGLTNKIFCNEIYTLLTADDVPEGDAGAATAQ